MRALITGASSGIGMEIAELLASRGYSLVLAARREDRLKELASRLPVYSEIIAADVSDEKECIRLYKAARGKGLEIVVNNAGFGLFGEFTSTSLNQELKMIDTNIKAVHILTKLAVCDFVANSKKGCVLNVASSASFMPGPLMSTYYATKNYVLRLTEAVREELRRSGHLGRIKVCALCPGPVNTEFNKVAGVRFALKGLSPEQVAQEAVDGLFDNKGIVVPGKAMKLLLFLRHFGSEEMLSRIGYHLQKKKASK